MSALGTVPQASRAGVADHQEFEAVLVAPFRADASGARTLRLHFSAPGERQARTLRWRLELLAPNGHRMKMWRGQQSLAAAPVDVAIPWRAQAGLRGGGLYRLRLRAGVDSEPAVEQSWEVAVGPAAASPAPAAALAPSLAAPDALPYTVYLGNLHSQIRPPRWPCTAAACRRRRTRTGRTRTSSPSTAGNGASSTTAATSIYSTAPNRWAGSATPVASCWPTWKRRKATTPACTA